MTKVSGDGSKPEILTRIAQATAALTNEAKLEFEKLSGLATSQGLMA